MNEKLWLFHNTSKAVREIGKAESYMNTWVPANVFHQKRQWAIKYGSERHFLYVFKDTNLMVHCLGVGIHAGAFLFI